MPNEAVASRWQEASASAKSAASVNALNGTVCVKGKFPVPGDKATVYVETWPAPV